MQGDTLYSLLQRVDELLRLARAGEVDEVSDGLEDIKEQLGEAMRHYESVCADRGVELPYRS
jgi:Family of unknown function (DUF6959)